MSPEVSSLIAEIMKAIPAIISAFFVGVGGLLTGVNIMKGKVKDMDNDQKTKIGEVRSDLDKQETKIWERYEVLLANYGKLAERIDESQKERDNLKFEIQELKAEVKQLRITIEEKNEIIEEKNKTIIALSIKNAQLSQEILEKLSKKSK